MGRVAGLAACSLLVSGCVSGSPAHMPSPERVAASLGGMIWPLPLAGQWEVTSGYGGRRHHQGVDLDGATGDPVFAAREGTVVFSGWKNGYGNTVVLDHGNGVRTLYAHAASLAVRTGERVAWGQPIAAVGATGNARGDHLHFEVSWAGAVIDPARVLPQLGDPRPSAR